ncbi:hypothetical protein EV121DRAFT_282136 [Schizophyllum commune]
MDTELDDAAITPWARPSDPNWHLHLPSAGIILHVVCIGIIEPCPDMFECTQYIERTPELRSVIACARREGYYEPSGLPGFVPNWTLMVLTCNPAVLT